MHDVLASHGQSTTSEILIPDYLTPYVSSQRWYLYTDDDHAVWAHLAATLAKQLQGRAIEPFFDGLSTLRFTEPRIPELAMLNQLLRPYRWRTVPVDGMLPPRIWIDFVAHRLMPVVVGIRTVENLEFNPTPDIFHDLFGHATLLVHRDFSYLLHRYAQIHAASAPLAIDPRFPYIKRLSEAKLHPAENRRLIEELQIALDDLDRDQSSAPKIGQPTLRRLAGFGWWITEYGLVETERGTKFYGASLCSSLDESQRCLTVAYKRRRLSRDTFGESYDATSPQTTLYVSDSFAHVKQLLRELAADAVVS